ncbi:MAG: MATE family efflux transporter, partial [Oscillospiraceae bacterium]
MLKKHFVTDKRFIMSIIAIAVPVALQNMISFGVNMMDSLMLGRLGNQAISAASLGGRPFFLMMIFGFGLASGGSVLIAQYWGKGDMPKIHRLITISLQLVTVVSLIFTVGCFLFPAQIIRVFTPDAALIKASVQYLKPLSISFFFYAFANCYMMSLRAVEKVKLSTYVYGISFFINVFFDYCLIFGKFGM